MLNDRTLILLGVGAAVGVALIAYVSARKVAGVAGDALQAVNPLNRDNVIYGGVNAAGAAITGDQSFNLGGALAEWFSPSVAAVNRSLDPDQARYQPQPAPLDAPANVWRDDAMVP